MRTLRNNRRARRLIPALLLTLILALMGVLPAAAEPELPPPPAPVMWGDIYNVGGFVPAVVDPKTIDFVHGPCDNTLGLGTEAFLSVKCGKLLVGPEVSDGEIARGRGNIERINPSNQRHLDYAGVGYIPLNEGGYDLASLGYGKIRIYYNSPTLQRDIYLNLVGEEHNNYLVIVTGIYGDRKSGEDRNTSLIVSDYEPGHNLFMIYPTGEGGGWLSQGQFEQISASSLGTADNCGDAGCPKLTAIFVNPNTGALLVLRRTSTTPWQKMWSNY